MICSFLLCTSSGLGCYVAAYWETVVGFRSFGNIFDSERNPVLGNEINMLYSVPSAQVLAKGNFWPRCTFRPCDSKYALRALR